MKHLHIENATRSIALALRSFLEDFTGKPQVDNWIDICRFAEDVIEPEYQKVVDNLKDEIEALEEELDYNEELEATLENAKSLGYTCIANINKLKDKLQSTTELAISDLPKEINQLLRDFDEVLEVIDRKVKEF